MIISAAGRADSRMRTLKAVSNRGASGMTQVAAAPHAQARYCSIVRVYLTTDQQTRFNFAATVTNITATRYVNQ